MRRRSPEYIVGVILLYAGLFLLLKSTSLFSFGFYRLDHMNTGAILIILVMIAILGYLIKHSDLWLWAVIVISVAFVLYALHYASEGFIELTAVDTVLILGLLTTGAALMIHGNFG